jgi:cobalt-precorrin 5A hydrolase
VSAALGVWPVRVEAERIGATLAERLGGDLFRPWEREEPQKSQFQALFRQRAQWVLVMATGIATRFVDGLLQDKHQDPAVVVVDEAGRYAVALVGGHEGGANTLAYRVANAVGAVPVVTTATEATRTLVVGVGCRKGVSEEQINQAILHALEHRALSAVREIATVDLKAEEPGLLAFAQRHGIPLRIITRQQIEARSWVGQPSEWVRQAVGLDGVCEPCALIASPRGRLAVPKTTLDGVAVAVVEDEWRPVW